MSRQREARVTGGAIGRAAPVLLAVFGVLAGILAQPGVALAKDYSMPEVAISATVAPNGSVEVRERRTFDFDGQFSFVYWELDTQGAQGIKVLGVTGPSGAYPTAASSDGVPPFYRVTVQGSTVRVDAYFALADTTATFQLDYTVVGAVTAWRDTAELYWKFIGDRSEKGTGHAAIDVALPAGVTRGDVRAWAHGPLNGVVAIEPDASVTLTVDDLPPRTFVEARILFPREAVPGAPAQAQSRVETVLAEETRWADEANRKREEARRRLFAGRAGAVVLAALGVGLFAFAYRRYGREHRPAFAGEYFRELPAKLPPAVVGVLWRMGSVTNEDMSATLLDLANRGVVTVEPVVEIVDGIFRDKEERTYRLALDRSKAAALEAPDDAAVHFVFDVVAGNDSFTIAELRSLAKDDPEAFREGLTEWKEAVKAVGKQQGFLERTGTIAMAWTIAAGILIAGAAWLLFMATSAWPALVAVAVGAAVAAGSPAMRRRSPAAAELHAKYRGLYNYMKDFGRLQEKPPTAVVLWEHFLVLAVVFGIADEVIENLQVKVPEVVGDPAFATAYLWTTSAGGQTSVLSSFSSGFSAAAGSVSSSGSGGGGGFSGGGGGGGGGGGAGAG